MTFVQLYQMSNQDFYCIKIEKAIKKNHRLCSEALSHSDYLN